MTPDVYAWAVKHGLSITAIQELKQLFRLNGSTLDMLAQQRAEPRSEAWAQSACRLAAAQAGYLVFRNNVGAMQDQTGRMVRFGLANDSRGMNERIKSGDLIGIKPNGQFWSREIKPEGWYYTGTDREKAQLAWVQLVTSQGGDAAFSTGGI